MYVCKHPTAAVEAQTAAAVGMIQPRSPPTYLPTYQSIYLSTYLPTSAYPEQTLYDEQHAVGGQYPVGERQDQHSAEKHSPGSNAHDPVLTV